MLRVEKESLNRKIGMLEVKVVHFQIEISRKNHRIGDLNRQLGKLKDGFFPDGNPELQTGYGCFLNVRCSLVVCASAWKSYNLLEFSQMLRLVNQSYK